MSRTFFIRRYQRGVKGSGTEDIFISPHEIPLGDLVRIAHNTGPGKYLLGERGPGIRGFRKITDCVVAEETDYEDAPEESRLFEAETISVRRNLKLAEMANQDLMDVMQSMVRTPLQGAEEYERFRADLQSLHSEMERRGYATPTNTKSAEGTGMAVSQKSPLFGVAVSPMMAGTIGVGVGALVGWFFTYRSYTDRLDNLNIRIQELEANVREAEGSIKRAEQRMEKKAEQQVAQAAAVNSPFDPAKALHDHFLSEFNFRNGPRY